MKRLTIIIILLILIPLSVEALYVNDEQGNRKTCIDISEESGWYQEYHKYEIKYDVKEHFNLEGTAENSYYVPEVEGYPKPLYKEKGISPYGYRKEYSDTEYRTRMDQLKSIYKLEAPEGKYVYTPFMGYVSYTPEKATNDVAWQEFWYEYFVPHEDCIPCSQKGLTESSGKCVTCYEAWGKNYPVFNKDAESNWDSCKECDEGTVFDTETAKCVDAINPGETTPPPTTTLPPTTQPPTTSPPATTSSSTTVPPQTTQPPDESKTPDELGPYDENKNYCGPNNVIAFSGHIFTADIADFGKSCYNHDKCYSSSGVSRKDCDVLFLRDMRKECLYKDGLKGLTCSVAAKLAYNGVRLVGRAFYEA